MIDYTSNPDEPHGLPDQHSDEPLIAPVPAAESTISTETIEPPSRFKKTLKIMGWSFLTIFFTLLFTLLKLPEERLKNYIQGNIAAALSSQGIGFTAASGHLSIFFGASYVMKDITLTFPPPAEPMRIAEATVSPSLLPLLVGQIGGRVEIRQSVHQNTTDGFIEAGFSLKKNLLDLTYKMDSIDLGKLGLLPALANIRGSAMLSGSGDFRGDLNDPPGWVGKIKLDLSRINIDPQTIMGFSVPNIRVSEGKIDLGIDKGKANIQTLKLGKSAADDIRATITGNLNLARQLGMSNANLKAEFFLSDNVLKSFVLLDALLGVGKQSDGSYAFTLTGPITAINPMPLGNAEQK
jgi:type II secretion system protein N